MLTQDRSDSQGLRRQPEVLIRGRLDGACSPKASKPDICIRHFCQGSIHGSPRSCCDQIQTLLAMDATHWSVDSTSGRLFPPPYGHMQMFSSSLDAECPTDGCMSCKYNPLKKHRSTVRKRLFKWQQGKRVQRERERERYICHYAE